MTKFKLVPHGNTSKHVKRAFAVFVAVVSLLTATVATNGSVLAYYPIPAEANGVKYYAGGACVRSTLRQDLYPTTAIAQQWNNAVNVPGDTVIALSAASTCKGYKLVIGTFSNPNYNSCLYFTDTVTFPFGDGSAMKYWQYGIGVYINAGIPSCVSTAQRRQHQIAAGIGYALGLNVLTASGYASRVMCTCSLDTVRSPDSASALLVSKIYHGQFGG